MKHSFCKWRTNTGTVRQVVSSHIPRIRLQQNGGGRWWSLGCPSAKTARFLPTDAARSADVISQLNNIISPAQRKLPSYDSPSKCQDFLKSFHCLSCTVANFNREGTSYCHCWKCDTNARLWYIWELTVEHAILSVFDIHVVASELCVSVCSRIVVCCVHTVWQAIVICSFDTDSLTELQINSQDTKSMFRVLVIPVTQTRFV
jgi:hypothetical protein